LTRVWRELEVPAHRARNAPPGRPPQEKGGLLWVWPDASPAAAKESAAARELLRAWGRQQAPANGHSLRPGLLALSLASCPPLSSTLSRLPTLPTTPPPPAAIPVPPELEDEAVSPLEGRWFVREQPYR
jgi:hypothetical protein